MQQYIVNGRVKAVCIGQRCFENNASDFFVGRIRWYNDDIFLWAESTGITRLTENDAENDALWLAKNRHENVEII